MIAEVLLNHAKDKLDQAYIHTHLEMKKKEALNTYHQWLNNYCHHCLTYGATSRGIKILGALWSPPTTDK